MSQKLHIKNFKFETDLSIFTENFIKNYNEQSNTGYLLVVDIIYPTHLYKEHRDLPFLPYRGKVKKVNKLLCGLNDKNNYSIYICTLKQALNHGLILKKVHAVISFTQDAWLKPYIDMNAQLRMKAANDFEKDFYKLCNNSVYGKTMENVRKHRDIQLVTTNKKRSILASEPNYHSTKYISKDLLIMEMKKREVYMNKPIYLGQVISDISKILMYEFCYDYLKPKYGKNIKLCYIDTGSFVIRIKTDNFYKDISNDIDKWFDTSNYHNNIDRPLQKGINKKVIGKFKDELGGRIMNEFCALRAKTYSFLIDGFTDEDYVKKCIVNKKDKPQRTVL